jgi:cyclopropane fatty-acyl-phospholipid synthase-like methyltransferase
MSDARTQLVRAGYDAIADHYLEWTTRIDNDPKVVYVEQLSARLADGARILELGCGAGEPCTRILAERFEVTGVDISAEQLDRARARIPSASFVHADLTTLEREPESYDAVVATYVLNHVPRDLLAGLLGRIAGWLVAGGYLLASFGTADEAEWTGDWLGATMFFSSWEPATNRRLLKDTGFELLVDELVTIHEPPPDGDAIFEWVLARR